MCRMVLSGSQWLVAYILRALLLRTGRFQCIHLLQPLNSMLWSRHRRRYHLLDPITLCGTTKTLPLRAYRTDLPFDRWRHRLGGTERPNRCELDLGRINYRHDIYIRHDHRPRLLHCSRRDPFYSITSQNSCSRKSDIQPLPNI